MGGVPEEVLFREVLILELFFLIFYKYPKNWFSDWDTTETTNNDLKHKKWSYDG